MWIFPQEIGLLYHSLEQGFLMFFSAVTQNKFGGQFRCSQLSSEVMIYFLFSYYTGV